jgi:hypothetical protein
MNTGATRLAFILILGAEKGVGKGLAFLRTEWQRATRSHDEAVHG